MTEIVKTSLTFGQILERLKEPGSIRSLVLLLFILRGQVVDHVLLEQIVNGILGLLALVSFFMPERTTVLKTTTTQIAETSEATKAAVEQTQQEVRETLSKLQGLLGQAMPNGALGGK